MEDVVAEVVDFGGSEKNGAGDEVGKAGGLVRASVENGKDGRMVLILYNRPWEILFPSK